MLKLLLIKWGKKYYILVFIILCTFFWFSCHNEGVEKQAKHQDGVVPTSIKQVVDVFELKYGDVKERNYNGQAFKFSITDVKDSLQRCDVLYSDSPNIFNSIRISAYLSVEIQGIGSQLNVRSKKCGPFFEFKNDGTDVQQVWDMLNIWQDDPKSVYELNFESAFNSDLGEGTLITNTSFSIYMASAYPILSQKIENTEINMYQFIFIITNQKTE